jgi:hypothetical protein
MKKSRQLVVGTLSLRPTFELALRVGPLRIGVAAGARGLLVAAEYRGRRWLLAIGNWRWIH